MQEVPIPGNVDEKGRRRTQRAALRRTTAALSTANDRIVEGRECFTDQREIYRKQN